jgi:hypothetical protein
MCVLPREAGNRVVRKREPRRAGSGGIWCWVVIVGGWVDIRPARKRWLGARRARPSRTTQEQARTKTHDSAQILFKSRELKESAAQISGSAQCRSIQSSRLDGRDLLSPLCQPWSSPVTREALVWTAPTSRRHTTTDTHQLQLQTRQVAHPGEREVTREKDPRVRAHARTRWDINWSVSRVRSALVLVRPSINSPNSSCSTCKITARRKPHRTGPGTGARREREAIGRR